jgi:hypothetical protein
MSERRELADKLAALGFALGAVPVEVESEVDGTEHGIVEQVPEATSIERSTTTSSFILPVRRTRRR